MADSGRGSPLDVQGQPCPDGRQPGAGAVLQVRLLGTFALAWDGRAVDMAAWRLQKARGLVKLLALAPGGRLAREQVLDLLWPELEPGAAANNLHYILHMARRLLGAPGETGARSVLRLTQGMISLQPPGGLWCDVAAFDAAAAEARRSREPAAYAAALALYTGDLLPEDRYEDWAAGRRESLRGTFLALLREAAGLAQERGDTVTAQMSLERLVGEEPADEDAHLALMRLHLQAGNRLLALRQYAQLEAALARLLDAHPAPDSRQLYQDIVAGRIAMPTPAPVAPAQVAEPRRDNLPTPLTSFLGRRREVDDVKDLLASTRLLTLTGAGGVGKTRLALAVAAEVEGYPDGVWLIDLTPLAEPALVPRAVARVVGLREKPGEELTVTLAGALRSRKLLLVLDNCEHLARACAALVATLLPACAGLRVLDTSREALRVPGEVTWRVPSLSIAPPDLPPSPETLAGSEAVALFVDRVRWRHPRFAVTLANAAAVAAICTRLDGIPLALELAAARTNVLTVEGIAARLDRALHLLDGAQGSVPTRQQTLRATLDWSCSLLSAAETRLLRRLSVFAGGCSLEATEAVCAVDPDERGDVLTLLALLIDKSLLDLSPVAGDARYRLLETMRLYARERLEESGEEDATRARHAFHYLEVAEAVESTLTTAGQAGALDRLEREHDNLRVALRWCLDHQEFAVGLRIAGALGLFWAVRGYANEGRRWLDALLAGDSAHCDATAPLVAVRAKALNAAGMLARDQSDFAGARALHAQSLELRRVLGDQKGIALALNSLGNVAREQSDFAQAAAFYEESLALHRALDNIQGCAGTLGNLGTVAQEQGDLERAMGLQEESLALYRQLGDQRGCAITLVNLGVLAFNQGDMARATSLYEQSLALRRELGDKRGLAIVLVNMAAVFQALGDRTRAAATCAESLALFPVVGDKRVAAVGLGGIASAACNIDPASAARLLSAAEAQRVAVGAPLPPAEQVAFDADVATVRSALDGAAFERAWAAGRTMSSEDAIAQALALAAEMGAR